MSSLITSGRAVVDLTLHYRILSASKTGRSGQLLSLATAGAPEGGLSGGYQGAILSSWRLNVKKEIPIIYSGRGTLRQGLESHFLERVVKSHNMVINFFSNQNAGGINETKFPAFALLHEVPGTSMNLF